MTILADRQRAEIDLRITAKSGLKLSADLTPAGLLAITVLVSGILLSTSALVKTAVREGKRRPSAAKD